MEVLQKFTIPRSVSIALCASGPFWDHGMHRGGYAVRLDSLPHLPAALDLFSRDEKVRRDVAACQSLGRD